MSKHFGCPASHPTGDKGRQAPAPSRSADSTAMLSLPLEGARLRSRSRARPALAPPSVRIARGRGPAGAGLLEWPPAASLRRWPRGRAVGGLYLPVIDSLPSVGGRASAGQWGGGSTKAIR